MYFVYLSEKQDRIVYGVFSKTNEGLWFVSDTTNFAHESTIFDSLEQAKDAAIKSGRLFCVCNDIYWSSTRIVPYRDPIS
jgi:hypothetical protein